ncbi:hypothetical protein [Pseudomonas sp. B21-053]|uniref:hypothetical protein n=1 Tax=Pseudomonas sp. B21-053 TaxID=2895493 RepID=UPI0022318B5C|nr:hypothetical protein [Pseudomonas sp. B21-053]UZE14184.1 hypothetical protein LOY68_11425 [Pseudomonas sp. B21-053]
MESFLSVNCSFSTGAHANPVHVVTEGHVAGQKAAVFQAGMTFQAVTHRARPGPMVSGSSPSPLAIYTFEFDI